MSKVKEVLIDYVTLRLTDNFNFSDFQGYVMAKRVDKKTGLMLPPVLRPDQFRLVTVGKDNVVVSFYNGGEKEAIKLYRRYRLPVTRVDLCIDIPCQDKDEAAQLFEGIDHDLTEWHEENGKVSGIATFRFQGRQSNKNGEFGRTMYSRQSDHHLRVYEKRAVLDGKGGLYNKHGIRLEWQLRHDAAREVFPLVVTNYPNNLATLFDVFQSITEKWLDTDIFNLGQFNPVEFKKAARSELSNFEMWVRSTIPRALVRELKSSGIDYAPIIADEMRRILEAEEQDKQVKIRTKTETAIRATHHQLEKKMTAPVRRPGGSHSRKNPDDYETDNAPWDPPI